MNLHDAGGTHRMYDQIYVTCNSYERVVTPRRWRSDRRPIMCASVGKERNSVKFSRRDVAPTLHGWVPLVPAARR